MLSTRWTASSSRARGRSTNKVVDVFMGGVDWRHGAAECTVASELHLGAEEPPEAIEQIKIIEQLRNGIQLHAGAMASEHIEYIERRVPVEVAIVVAMQAQRKLTAYSTAQASGAPIEYIQATR